MRPSGAAGRAKEGSGGCEPHDSSFTYEAALIECAAGSKSGLARIYANEAAQLREFAGRIVRNRYYAEDIIHDAFAQILRDAGSFDPARGPARAWIYAVVRNTALKSIRHSDREVAVEAGLLSSICNQRQTSNVSSSHLAEITAAQCYLEKLEPKRRASLILAIVDGRTHAEIAQYLGVPIGTVKAWIRRELIVLRQQLR